MPALSDAVVIGTVLTLVFAAVAYYLYSRIIQVESKASLMETILLNLKMATEATLLSGGRDDIPTPIPRIVMNNSKSSMDNYDENNNDGESSQTIDNSQNIENSVSLESNTPREEVEVYKQVLENAHSKEIQISASPKVEASIPSIHVTKDNEGNSKVHIGFESMSWKELCAEAKKRNITGTSHMNRRKLIDILNKRDGIVTDAQTSSSNQVQTSINDTWSGSVQAENDLPSAQEFAPDGVELSSL